MTIAVISCIELFRRLFGVPRCLRLTILLIFVSFCPTFRTDRKKQNMSNKVNERRERKIFEAKKNNDWDEIIRLLNQSVDNQERKDRKNHLISLNSEVVTDGCVSEIMDFVQDNTYNPIEKLLNRELTRYLVDALSKLSDDDYIIVIDIALYGKSALQLTKETSIKSHKTVKSHYEKAIQNLKKELEKYF